VHLDARVAEHNELSIAGETEFAFCDQAIDITYVRTWEGWLYLSFVLDAYSRKIVGWSMSNSLKSELVLDVPWIWRSTLAEQHRQDRSTTRSVEASTPSWS
jgi:transposase InsO family protein